MRHYRLLLAEGALLLSPSLALAGAQCEETLSDDIASAMRGSTNNINPPRPMFISAQEGKCWLSTTPSRLVRYVLDEGERRRLLINIRYEASRAGLDPQVVLGLIEVESVLRQYTAGGVGVRGPMQVMPFWKDYIGRPPCSLPDIRTNLRYDYTILHHYNNLENGNLYRVLTCFSDSLGSGKYLNAVLGAWRNRWQWG